MRNLRNFLWLLLPACGLMLCSASCSSNRKTDKEKKSEDITSKPISGISFYECDEVAADSIRRHLSPEVRNLFHTDRGYYEIIGDASASDTTEINGLMKEMKGQLSPDIALKWGRSLNPYNEENIYSLYVLKAPGGKPALSGPIIAEISADESLSPEESPHFNITLTDSAREEFSRLTKNNIGRCIAIVVNGKVLSAPRVNAEIVGGRVWVTGPLTQNEAKEIVRQLTSSHEE